MSRPIGTDEMLDRIEELEAQLAEEIKISNERGNHIEFVLLPQMNDLSAQLDAMTGERDAAIPRAYAMGVEDADKKLIGLIAKHKATSREKGTYPYLRESTIYAIRAMTAPADLVKRVLKTKETDT